MSKKLVAAFLASLALQSLPAEEQQSQRVQQLLDAWTSHKPVVTAELDQNVKGDLRRRAQRDVYSRALLIYAGDSATIQSSLNDFHSEGAVRRYGADALRLSRSSDVIALVAPDLDRNETTMPSNIAHGLEVEKTSAISVYAGVIVRQIIADCDDFSPEVKKWASSVEQQNGYDRDKIRATMRNWWHQNKNAITARNYAAARPPAPTP